VPQLFRRGGNILLGRSLTDAEAKRSNWVRDVLDQLLAQVFKDHAAVMAQVIAHAPGDADLAALDQPLQPSGDVHAIAKDIAFLEHYVANIDAYPKAHPLPFRLALVGFLQRRLDLDRAANRVENAREFGQYAIAGGVRDPTSIPADELVDYGATSGQRRHRRFLVALHQATVPPHLLRGWPRDVFPAEEPPSEKPLYPSIK
jgi:hypothetical protein